MFDHVSITVGFLLHIICAKNWEEKNMLTEVA